MVAQLYYHGPRGVNHNINVNPAHSPRPIFRVFIVPTLVLAMMSKTKWASSPTVAARDATARRHPIVEGNVPVVQSVFSAAATLLSLVCIVVFQSPAWI